MFIFTLIDWRGILCPWNFQRRIALSFTRVGSGLYDGSVSSRAQMVLWYDAGYRKREIAAMSGASRPTVDKWLARYEQFGLWQVW
jgi:hypothetical protein